MEWHTLFGPVLREHGWVPAPSYLLRRSRVLAMLDQLPPGGLLEVGCGAGALLCELKERGFACTALETSPDALAVAKAVHSSESEGRHPVLISNEPLAEWSGRFDYLLAFEVLEHIEDDAEALLTWASWLRPGGHLLLSVPAHERRWTASDEWAGHFRRYEGELLRRLLVDAGLAIEQFECYGFPLGNLVEPLRARHHARELKRRQAAESDKYDKGGSTAQSGVARSLESRLFPLQASWIGVQIFRVAFLLQRLFRHTEFGTGYVVLARK